MAEPEIAAAATSLVPLWGGLAIVALFSAYGCYEWGRHVLAQTEKGQLNADKARKKFALPAVVASLLPVLSVSLFQNLGFANLDDGTLTIMLVMITAMAAGFVLLAVAVLAFSLKLRKAAKS